MKIPRKQIRVQKGFAFQFWIFCLWASPSMLSCYERIAEQSNNEAIRFLFLVPPQSQLTKVYSPSLCTHVVRQPAGDGQHLAPAPNLKIHSITSRAKVN
jgi:hypothetical protein